MIIYEHILDKSIKIDPIQWRMPIPEKIWVRAGGNPGNREREERSFLNGL